MAKRLLMIDNYDSFTFNVVQYLEELGARVDVFRNDKISLAQIKKMKPAGIIISPGPGSPDDAGISNKVIETFSGEIPILGICLGHQCIAQVFGGKIIRAKNIMHGKTSKIMHTKQGVFKGIRNGFDATRYHSLILKKASLPKSLEVTAKTKQGEIMGIQHKQHKTYGIQFHPESIMTRYGHDILDNFIQITKR